MMTLQDSRIATWYCQLVFVSNLLHTNKEWQRSKKNNRKARFQDHMMMQKIATPTTKSAI
jgi:hypothetical protein